VGALAPLTRQNRGYEDTIFALESGLQRGHPFPVQFLFLCVDLIIMSLRLSHLVLNLLFEIPYSYPAVIFNFQPVFDVHLKKVLKVFDTLRLDLCSAACTPAGSTT
jgi:hypothetical protein